MHIHVIHSLKHDWTNQDRYLPSSSTNNLKFNSEIHVVRVEAAEMPTEMMWFDSSECRYASYAGREVK